MTGSPAENRISAWGSCRAALIISRPIDVDLTYDPRSGTYRGESVMLQQHLRLAAQWTSRSAALNKSGLRVSRTGNLPLATITIVFGLLISTATVSGQSSSASSAGSWQPWVLTSTKDLQTAPLTDQTAELQQLHSLAKQRDPATLERIRYWDFWSPSFRWNEMLADISTATPLPTNAASRAFAMLNVAIDDALTAAWDSKVIQNRRYPTAVDSTLSAAVALSLESSDPCEHSVAAGAAAAIIGHVYPKDAQRVTAAAEEASRSRILAGAVFPSDAQAGLELGRKVAERVIEYAKIPDTKWSGSMPSGVGSGREKTLAVSTTWNGKPSLSRHRVSFVQDHPQRQTHQSARLNSRRLGT